MTRPPLVRMLLVLIFGLFGAAGSAVAQSTSPSPPVVVTTGESVIKRAPDRAWLTVATEARDINAGEARRKNAEAMTAVQGALKAAGVDPASLRTTGFSLVPEMEWNNGRSILRGYIARNQIEVRIDNLDRLPAILDAANTPKGVALSINGPRFDLKDQASAENDALKLAVESALARAQAMAAGARRTLGQILRIDDQQAAVVPPPMPIAMRAVAASAPSAETPVTPGEIEIRARVMLTVVLISQ